MPFFMLMMFFDSMKDFTCMLGPFFSQSVHVGRHRRPWFYPLFFLLELFTRCLVKILQDVFKKIQYLKKWGLWPSNRKGYQGQPLWAAWTATVPPSRASWLGVSTTILSLWEKNCCGHLVTIKIHALKGLNAIHKWGKIGTLLSCY